MVFKVVMTTDSGRNLDGASALERVGATLQTIPCPTEAALISHCHDAHAVLVGANEPYSAHVIASLENCKVISRMGIGFNNIDVAAATRKEIPVSLVPDYCVEEVSDHALAFMLTFNRRLPALYEAVRAGEWRPGSAALASVRRPIHRLAGQTLGIIGIGRIGQALARKAKCLGLRIIAFDPYVDPQAMADLGYELVDLDTLFRESDYVSLHAALTAETKHLIDETSLAKMKSNAVIINNARGGLIDEAALYRAISDGRIAGAGIDVTDPEPIHPDSPLLQLKNVLVTGHSSFYSVEATNELYEKAIDAVVQALTGHMPRYLANPELART